MSGKKQNLASALFCIKTTVQVFGIRAGSLAIMIFTLTLPLFSALSEEDWTGHPEWLGHWKATPEISRLLGFESEKGGRELKETLQIGFFLSKEDAVKVLRRERVELVEKRLDKLNHVIVAAGQWRECEEGEVDSDCSLCFVTEKNGSTFIWFGDQADSYNGAKVHFMRGADPEHDLLIIDSGGLFPKRFQGEKYPGLNKAVSYRRTGTY